MATNSGFRDTRGDSVVAEMTSGESIYVGRCSRLKSPYGRFSLWLKQHFILASLTILVCALGPRVGMAVVADPAQLAPPDSDSPTYLVPALSLIESGAYLNDHGNPEVSRTPGYPVFLAALMSIVGKDVHSLAITQSIALSTTILLLYWLANKILPPVMAFTGCLLALCLHHYRQGR